MRKRASVRLAVGVVVLVGAVSSVVLMATASADSPVPVPPYTGFNPILTRAPYLTDLTQTSASVNWATTSATPGSVLATPTGSGSSCPASVTAWSMSAATAPTSLPAPVNGVSPVPSPSLTSRQFTVNGVSEYQNSVVLTGLTPGTQYCYAVFSGNTSGSVDLLPPTEPAQFFTTLSPTSAQASTPVSFDVIDDTGENYYYTSRTHTTDLPFPNGFNPDQASLDAQIGHSGAGFLISAGDIAYSGTTQSTFGDLQQTGTQPEVSNIFGPFYNPQTGGIPIFAGPGDHGQNINPLKVFPTSNTAAASGGTYAYDSYTGIDGINGASPDTWYAFSSANVRIYVLDGAWSDAVANKLGTTTGGLCGSPGTTQAIYCEPYQADTDVHWQTSSPEYQWLQRDLAEHPGGVKLAVWHYPLRSDNASQPSDVYLQNSAANPNASTSLEALLAANGVQLAFNGHAHTYQRIVPSGPGQLTNYVTGGGGGVLEPVLGGLTCSNLTHGASPVDKDIYAIGWNPAAGVGSSCSTNNNVAAPASAADVYNFLKVTVAGNRVTVTPYNAAGGTFDVQTYTYPATAGPSTPASVTAAATSTTSVALSWAASTEAGGTIASYRIYRNGSALATVGAGTTTFTDTGAQPGTTYTYSVAAVDTGGHASWPGVANQVTTPAPVQSGAGTGQQGCSTHLPSGAVVGAAATDDGSGYYEVDKYGDVAAFGTAVCYGGMTGTPLSRPIVGMTVDPATGGYWLVASDGGVFSFNAPFRGSTGNIRLNKPIVGMGATPDGAGYWLVASDGGVFSFNATFHGGTGLMKLNKPIVGMAVDRSTGGYWLVASDGGVFNFHAPFDGATGGMKLNQPIVGIDAVSDGSGYRLVASDGGVFTGFNMPFYGGTGLMRLNRPIVTTINDNAGDGYWLVASDGGVFSFHAPFYGSAAG
jgi:Purple acid Phosphatase, N-terminal domain/Calcineurin-like phosphoesterase/Fibronectin type III domain